MWSTRDLTAAEQTLGNFGYIATWTSAPAWYDIDMEATFHNPHSLGEGNWDYGFIFHGNDAKKDYIILTGHGKWYHNTNEQGTWEFVAKGEFDARLLDTLWPGSNSLSVSVNGTDVTFMANGTRIADIRLILGMRQGVTLSPRGSRLGVAACIFRNGCIRPATVKVTDFKVSPL
jgi:hypothetical protein